MKTIFRILVILVVAVLVGGMFYGIVTASSSTSQTSISERPAGDFTLHDRENGTGGIQFPADAIKNLAIISIISVVYLNAQKWLGRKKLAAKVV
jgi:hypothetical protein